MTPWERYHWFLLILGKIFTLSFCFNTSQRFTPDSRSRFSTKTTSWGWSLTKSKIIHKFSTSVRNYSTIFVLAMQLNNTGLSFCLEKRDMLFHQIITITVRQQNPIDYYSCKFGKVYLTHTIDWSKLSFE